MTYRTKRRLNIALAWVGYFVVGLGTAIVIKQFAPDCKTDSDTIILLGFAFIFWPMLWVVGFVYLIGMVLCWIF